MSATNWKVGVCIAAVVLCIVAGEAPAPPLRPGPPDMGPDGPFPLPDDGRVRPRPDSRTPDDTDRRRPDQPQKVVEKVNITVSKETTHVVEPLNADGTVNYLALVNASACKDLSLRDNAATLLLTALGPNLFDRTVRKKALLSVKMSALPARGDYFRTLAVHVKRMEDDDDDDDEKPADAGDPLAVAQDLLDKSSETIWSAKQYPLIADWLERNEDSLDLVVSATERSRLYLPVVSPDDPPATHSAKVPIPARLKEVARGLIARAMLRAGAGEFEDARADLLAAHKLARLIAQVPTLIEWSAATEIEAIACKAGRALAASGKLPADQARAFLAELNSLPAMPHPRNAFDQFERFAALDAVIEHARNGLDEEFGKDFNLNMDDEKWAGYKIDWDDVLKRFNRFYDRQVAATSDETYIGRKIALDAFGLEFEGFSQGATKRWKNPKEVAEAMKDAPASDQRQPDRRSGSEVDQRRRRDGTTPQPDAQPDREVDQRRRKGDNLPQPPVTPDMGPGRGRPGMPGPGGMPGMPGPGPESPRPGKISPTKPDAETTPAMPQRKPIDQMVGDILLVTVLHSAHKPLAARKSCELHDRATMELTITRVAMALSAYKTSSGQYPRELSSLSPGLLRRIPEDLFVNGSLRYKTSSGGYVLYSVGPNMTDNDGRNDKATGDDDISARAK